MRPYGVEQMMALQQIFSSLPGNIFLLLPDPPSFTIAAVTEGSLITSGRTREELLGKGLFESFPNNPDDETKSSKLSVSSALKDVLQRSKPNNLPVQRYDIITSEGVYEERYWSAHNKPVLNENGQVIFIVHDVEDITDRVRASTKEARFKSMEKENQLFMQAPVSVGILRGEEYIVQLANKAILEAWGRPADVIGRPLLEVMPELDAQIYPALFKKVMETGEPFYGVEMPATIVREGKEEIRYFNFVYQPYYENGEKKSSGIFIVAHDITEMVLARKRVEESHHELEFVMDVMPQMVWQAMPDGRADYFNKVYLDYTGLSIGQLIGEQWRNVLHQDDRKILEDRWTEARNERDVYMVEHRILGKDGTYKWFLSRGVPLKDEHGEILKWYGTSTDIHEQKAISELLEIQVRERTKELEIRNKELEQFTYVSHHDLQEPLRKVVIFAKMVKDDRDQVLSASAGIKLDKVIQSATRMSKALNDVLNFASLSKGEQARDINLNDVVGSVLVDLEVVIGEKKATIVCDELPEIQGIPPQIVQLFYNLINNSLKFARNDEAPKIQISSRCPEKDEIVEAHPEVDQVKRYVEIAVKDNGIGFKQDFAKGIFLMFQRLHSKDEYSGTGIGLAFCKKVIGNHKGKIWAEGKEGNGAVFTFLLPLQ